MGFPASFVWIASHSIAADECVAQCAYKQAQKNFAGSVWTSSEVVHCSPQSAEVSVSDTGADVDLHAGCSKDTDHQQITITVNQLLKWNTIWRASGTFQVGSRPAVPFAMPAESYTPNPGASKLVLKWPMTTDHLTIETVRYSKGSGCSDCNEPLMETPCYGNGAATFTRVNAEGLFMYKMDSTVESDACPRSSNGARALRGAAESANPTL